MNNCISKCFKKISLNPSPKTDEFANTQTYLNIQFPIDYKEFIQEHNGAEGEIGANSYIVLWSLGDIEVLNEAYGVAKYAPGLVLFGSAGGNCAYAFDNRFEGKPIVEVPFIEMSLDNAKKCANTFVEFLLYLYNI